MATYDNPVKERSRQEIAKFIRENLRHKPPEKWRVFTLLGARRDSEVAIEMPIWLKLGVRPENIFTVEREPAAHRRLLKFCEQTGVRIHPVPISVADYFVEQPEVKPPQDGMFDVIYLDYMGHQRSSELLTVRHIAGKWLLSHHGIFIQNHAAKREGRALKEKLAFLRLGDAGVNGELDTSVLVEKQRALLLKGSEAAYPDREDLREIRFLRTRSFFNDGRASLGTCSIFENFFGRERALQNAVELRQASMACYKQEELDEFEKRFRLDPGLRHPLFEDGKIISRGHTTYGICLYAALVERLEKLFLKRGWKPASKVTAGVVYALTDSYGRGYLPRATKCFSYTSDTNMNMQIDAFAFSPCWETYQGLRNCVDWSFKSGDFEIRTNDIKKMNRAMGVLPGTIGVVTTPKLPRREYLGSAWKPMPEYEKAGLIDLVKSGSTIEEIKEAGWTLTDKFVRRLAAYQAHCTRKKKREIEAATKKAEADAMAR